MLGTDELFIDAVLRRCPDLPSTARSDITRELSLRAPEHRHPEALAHVLRRSIGRYDGFWPELDVWACEPALSHLDLPPGTWRGSRPDPAMPLPKDFLAMLWRVPRGPSKRSTYHNALAWSSSLPDDDGGQPSAAQVASAERDWGALVSGGIVVPWRGDLLDAFTLQGLRSLAVARGGKSKRSKELTLEVVRGLYSAAELDEEFERALALKDLWEVVPEYRPYVERESSGIFYVLARTAWSEACTERTMKQAAEIGRDSSWQALGCDDGCPVCDKAAAARRSPPPFHPLCRCCVVFN